MTDGVRRVSRQFLECCDDEENGILEARLHTNNGPFEYRYTGGSDPSAAPRPSAQLGGAFSAIASDRDNKVVILTGTGEWFTGPPSSEETFPNGDAMVWDTRRRDGGTRAIMSLLDMEAPIISCINGPAWRHSEIALLADIVLAADTVTIQDHNFINRTVPGDGIALFLLSLLGFNRARYYMLTGKGLTATEAQQFGVVAEVMPAEQLLPRARELAAEFAEQNPLVLRYTRLVFTHAMKQIMDQALNFELTLEALAGLDEATRRG